ncbi:hypothetical protein MLD38_011575 [Melastoma candidum]|uniref:Uncharacterized protein n=1 Tax=Melastoma candidum TaxID=119954 RepID=A0ACB9R3I7_9MYRT|nr:hypothetical protein MLD38_011575 [Melastoma candidum]
MNNISVPMPTTALLRSHFLGKSNSIYTTDFPSKPLVPFNYTGTPPNTTFVMNRTKMVILQYNRSVKLVMQDRSIISAESHPFHLHGFKTSSWWAKGSGTSNCWWTRSSATQSRCHPASGSSSVYWPTTQGRGRHLEVHTSWGLKMAWIVRDGNLPSHSSPSFPSPSFFFSLLFFGGEISCTRITEMMVG